MLVVQAEAELIHAIHHDRVGYGTPGYAFSESRTRRRRRHRDGRQIIIRGREQWVRFQTLHAHRIDRDVRIAQQVRNFLEVFSVITILEEWIRAVRLRDNAQQEGT